MTAVLYQVPNQPCTFSSDPQRLPRSEDDLIALTWRHLLDHPAEVSLPRSRQTLGCSAALLL
jgi:PhoPQ-activated pathogenicity-related protein